MARHHPPRGGLGAAGAGDNDHGRNGAHFTGATLSRQLWLLLSSRMASETRAMPARRRLALVAHDNKKADLLDWTRFNRELLSRHDLLATGTTGRLLREELGLEITCLRSGPLGGDQQLGALIAAAEVDVLIFFWDPLEPQPHDPDVKALLRIAVVWNTPVACNRSSADFLISSPLLHVSYEALIPSYDEDRDQADVA
jgi:methylglyoxal synthase